MRKKAPAPGSTRSSNRTVVQASPVLRHRAPACPQAAATQPNRRCGAHSDQSHLRPGLGQGVRGSDLSAPLIPLTLRAMHRTRHPRARSLARPALLLSSVILLAFACFPVFAQAETVYDPEPTTIPGETKPAHHKATNNSSNESSPANASNAPGGGSGNNSGNGSGGVNSGSGQNNPGTTGEGGTGQGNPGSGSSNQNQQQGNGSQQQGGQQQQQQQAENAPASTTSSSGGSSSPLLPILIAIAVLAAISIGAVVLKQRRQRRDPGATVSPKAN